MVTYQELESEQVWHDEYVSPAMDTLANRLRSYFQVGSSEIGCKGDNNHLAGYHRSKKWTEDSIYCTSRTYGNTYPLDVTASTSVDNALRAFDLGGMPEQQRWAFTRRLDEAVRAGKLPAVAQWFGTFDGNTVVGWSYGHAATADSSHLFHTHISIWTSYVNNGQQMQLLGDLIIGDDMTPEEHAWLAELHLLTTVGKRTGAANSTAPSQNQTADGGKYIAFLPRVFQVIGEEFDATNGKIDLIEGGDCDLTETTAALNNLVAELAALRDENRALRMALAAAYTPPPVI